MTNSHPSSVNVQYICQTVNTKRHPLVGTSHLLEAEFDSILLIVGKNKLAEPINSNPIAISQIIGMQPDRARPKLIAVAVTLAPEVDLVRAIPTSREKVVITAIRLRVTRHKGRAVVDAPCDLGVEEPETRTVVEGLIIGLSNGALAYVVIWNPRVNYLRVTRNKRLDCWPGYLDPVYTSVH